MAAEAQRAPLVRERTLVAVEQAHADRVVALISTVEYIRCLRNVVQDQLEALQKHVQQYGALAAGADAWGQIEIVLNLLDNQAAIVADVVDAFDAARTQVSA